ncbi:MAG: hypothetical protein K2X87_09540 [Gemmataceae bacterium]|nr:hypothetical protein [Gemmataceae bacterium]
MNPAGTIVVKRYRLSRPPADPPTTRTRFSAAFVGGRHDRQAVADRLSPEDAIGSLIRQVVRSMQSGDEALTFLAGLFADLGVRSVDVAIARAVWIAAAHPRRENPGVRVEVAGATRPGAKGPRQPTRGGGRHFPGTPGGLLARGVPL